MCVSLFSSCCILCWVFVPKNVHIILIVLTLMHIIYLIFYLSVCLSLDKLSESRSIRVSSDDLMCVYLCLFKMKTEWNIGENQQQQQPYCKQNNQSQASQLDSRTRIVVVKLSYFNSTQLSSLHIFFPSFYSLRFPSTCLKEAGGEVEAAAVVE